MEFEENWPRCFRRKVVQGVDGRMNDNGQQVITIAHSEPLAQLS